MSCSTNHSTKQACGCGCHSNLSHNPQFWSKKKKIRVLENYLSNIEEQVRDIKDMIDELKQQ